MVPPVLLLGLPPVVEAKHDGEGAGGQHLLIVVVVQAVSCCQGKSVANLFESVIHTNKKNAALVGDVLTSTLLHLLFT